MLMKLTKGIIGYLINFIFLIADCRLLLIKYFRTSDRPSMPNIKIILFIYDYKDLVWNLVFISVYVSCFLSIFFIQSFVYRWTSLFSDFLICKFAYSRTSIFEEFMFVCFTYMQFLTKKLKISIKI